MARPQKNNADYFPHDAGMRNHRKIKALRNKFGIAGYGIWCMLLEHLTGADGNEFDEHDDELELMAGDFGVSVTEIRDVLNFCYRIELLFNKNGFAVSESLNQRLAPVYLKRVVAKELSEKQRRKNGRFCINNTESSGVSVTEIPHSKVNESKVQKSIVHDIVAGKPATIDERKKIFYGRCAKHVDKYSKEMVREFYDYWTEMNEGGRRMRFEMQKVFDTGRRLKKWKDNETKKIHGNGKQNKGTSRGADAKIEFKGFGTWDTPA